MRVFVTGSCGFIGRRLCKKLVKNGHYVVGYDLESPEKLDIRDAYTLHRKMAEVEPDIVYHLAARAGVGMGEQYPDEYVSTNLVGTRNVVEAAKKSGVGSLVYFSSSSVFGGSSAVNDTAPRSPIGLYGVTKAAGEMLVSKFHGKNAIVRPFSVYGPDGRSDMVIYKWINRIKKGQPIDVYGEGLTSRGYTYVDDLVNGVVRMGERMHRENMSVGFVNFGGSDRVSISDLLNLFKEACEEHGYDLKINNLPLPDYDIPHSSSNSKKAREMFGFVDNRSFSHTVKQILDYELRK